MTERNATRGEGSAFLKKMSPVLRKVQQVVQQIHTGSAQPESQEGHQGLAQQHDLTHPVRHDQRNEHQKILRPLMQTNRFEVGFEVVACPIVKNPGDHRLPLGHRFHAASGIDQQCLSGHLP